ncbi:MAG TPA: hypothetical protein VMH27_01760 [Puia sp.]|nr:hypothetical protein [Puia sp.]
MRKSIIGKIASLTALTLITLVLSQCKKSGGSKSPNNGSGYYMKFNLDGKAVEYSSQPVAEVPKPNSDGLYSAVLIAYQNVNAGTPNSITIIVYSSSAIAANVAYNDPGKATETNGSQVPQSTVFWYDSSAAGYLTAGEFADASGNVLLSGVVANSMVTITELTGSDVKGTFSGTVYRSDFGKSDVITDGQFYLKREQ